MVVNQSVSGLNRGLSSNFSWLRNANHVKFMQECVMCMEKHILVKKDDHKWAKIRFATTSLSQKDSP